MDDKNDRTGLEIALIGMAGRFPGAKNINDFWNNLKNGVESISFLTDEELEELGIPDKLLKNPNYIRVKGGVLEDSEYFDASFFGYLPAEAQIMDPQIRLFHECAWEALEDAGYDPDGYEGLIGLYGGGADHFYWEALTAMTTAVDMIDSFTALQLNDKDFLTARVSFKLNLKGPAITLHTACSTSLVAVDQACRGLLSGLCDMALAGGVAVNTREKTGVLYKEGTILSRDGHCRAFDEKAAGTVFGEGLGIVVLKRLEEAIADGDHIYCVVKGFAINNDGIRKAGFAAPSIEGQAEVIRAALQMAELSPESIGYIETHGTGTALGDSVEIEGLKLAFNTKKRNYCAVGSVKPNIGHLDTAAGIAGLIKTALALKYKLIPPSINFDSPNPEIDIKNSPFFVNSELKEWGNDRYLLRAGVSSFGIGGTNAHVVLEEAPQSVIGKEGNYQLIVQSAKTQSALEKMTVNLEHYFKGNPDVILADAAYTLQVGRRDFNHRKMLVCSTVDEAIDALSNDDPQKIKTSLVKEDNRYMVFMFSGQGAQYVNMGLHLYQNQPLFRQEMDRCLKILNGLMDYDIKGILYPSYKSHMTDKSYKNMDQTEIAQPVLFVFEYALARLLMKWGIKPDAMIGHSIGEYTAACLAGVFSLEDALGLVVLRGRLMQKMPGGAMLSVPLPEEELIPLLKMNQDLSLAAVNGPSRCVVSGTHEAIEAFEKLLKEKEYEWTRLHTSHAFHSKMMQPILPEFEEKVKQIALNKPKLPYLANLTGNWVKEEEAADPRYWARHLRETVRFSDGIKKLPDKRNPLFIEVGPGNALTTLVRVNMAKKTGGLIINVVRHPGEETADDFFLLDKIGQLWLQGIKIDWNAFYVGEQRQRISLPTYPFERKKYRIEGDPYEIGANMLPRTALVKKPDMGYWFYALLWEQSLLHSHPSVGKPEPLSWLIFIDETGLGTRLVKRLEQMGQNITSVRVGKEFIKQNGNPYIYMMNPSQFDAYDQLFYEIRELDRIPDKILHLWNVDKVNGNDYRPNLEGLDESQDLGLYSLLNIVQAAGRQKITNKIQISVLTSNMQQVTGEEIIRPEKSTILGAVKIIPLEYININCRSIDIVLPEPGKPLEAKLDDLLLKELMTDTADKVIAFRGLNRWTPIWKPYPLIPPEERGQRFRNEGVYLIIGGFGGMGFTFAQYLAKTFRARLILVGRSAFPRRDQWKEWLDSHEPKDPVSLRIRKIQDLEKQGAEIMVACADVSDYQRMEEVITQIKERFGRINGVLHAAGVIDYSGVIQKRTREMTETVTAPKVRGTLVLDSLLSDENLDFLVLCSSIGNVLYKFKFGEVGYAAANEFLESFANHKASVKGNCAFTVAINWTDWLEVGMSMKAALKLHDGKIDDIDYEKEFYDAVTPAEGVEVFRRILANQCHHLTVATKDLNLMVEQVFRSKSQESPSPGDEVGEINEILPGRVLDPRPELSTRYAAPGNKVEQKLANLLQQYFGIENLGIHDDFFELGGDSLKALTVASRIHQLFSVEITLPIFFSSPTIAGFADYIKKAKRSEFFTVTPVEKKEYYPLSSAQTRFYILQQIETTIAIYNMPKIMTFNESLEKDKLGDTFRALIQRHESLRTSFAIRDGIPVQVIHGKSRFEMEFYDLKAANHSLKVDINPLIELIENFVRPFDLSQHPLLRARLIRTVEDRHFLLVDMHHMISDKFSLIVLEKDFLHLYSQGELTPLKLQYKDYAEWQNHEQQISLIKQQEEYWLKEFSEEIPVLNLPTDYARPDTQNFEGRTTNFRMGSEETKALQKIASEQEATLFMVFLALECVWLSKLCGQEDIVIGAPLAGRNHPDFEKMIGIFLKTLALRNFPKSRKTFKEFLAEVRDRTLKALENQDYCFEDLVDTLDVRRDISRNPLFDAAINFYNFEEKTPSADGSKTEAPDSDLTQILAKYGSDIAHNDLMLYVEQNGEDLLLSLEYCTKLFKQETIERFIKYFNEITAHVIENENIKLEDIHISHELIKSESGILQEDLEDFDI